MLLCQVPVPPSCALMSNTMSKQSNKADNWYLSANKGPEPVYLKNFKIENKNSTTFLKFNDYKCKGYVHLNKVNKVGKHTKITLTSEEFFNLFDDANSKKFKGCMEDCLKKITTFYGVLPGSQQEEITYENIPKSVRVMEMQKSATENLEEQKFIEEKLAEYRKEFQNRKRKMPQHKKHSNKKQLTEESEEDEDEDDEEDDEENEE